MCSVAYLCLVLLGAIPAVSVLSEVASVPHSSSMIACTHRELLGHVGQSPFLHCTWPSLLLSATALISSGGSRLTWEAAEQRLWLLSSLGPDLPCMISLSSRPFMPAHRLDEERSVSGGL